jgi:hypothetical protein
MAPTGNPTNTKVAPTNAQTLSLHRIISPKDEIEVLSDQNVKPNLFFG